MIQVGYSPGSSIINDFYIAYSLNYKGLLKGRDSDVLGLALSSISLNNTLMKNNPENYEKRETAIELTYKYKVSERITSQPNIQYIIHPGMKSTYENVFVGMLRPNWNYN